MKPRFRSAAVLSSITVALFASPAAHAALSNWTGATAGTWGTTTNWSGGAVPTSVDDLTVLGPANVAGALTINVNVAAPANTINFTNTAATILSNTTSGADRTITLSSSGTAMTIGAGAVTIGSSTANQGVNIALGANQTWNVGAGGLTMNSIVSGSFGLTKTGTGVLNLSRANTYNGTTTLNGTGAVVLGNATSLGSGSVSVTGSSRINTSGATITYANPISVGAALTLQNPNPTTSSSTTATFSGALTGSSAITLPASGVNAGIGILAFTNAANTFTGNVLLSASGSGDEFFSFSSLGDGGTLSFGKNGNRQGMTYTGTSNIVFNTRTITLASTFSGGATNGFDGGGSNPIMQFQSNGTGTVTFNSNMVLTSIASSGTFFFDGTNTGNNTFAGTIGNPTGFNLNIGKFGSGTWVFSGANTYAGNTVIAGGILSVNAIATAATAQPLGKGPLIQLAAGNIGASGTLVFTGGTNSTTDKQVQIGGLVLAQTSAGSILNNGSGTLTFSNAAFNPTITGTTGARTLTLGGTNTGANTISGIIKNNDTAGAVALTKADAGTWVLSGANSYTGLTTISGGVLRITNNTSLGTVAGNVTVASGSGLEIDGTGGAVTVGAEAISIAGGGVTLPTPNLGAIRNIAGANTYGGTVTMTAQSRINSDSGTLTLNNATAAVTGAFSLIAGGAGNITISTPMTNGVGGLVYDGTGTLVIGSAVNTFTGAVSVSGAGGVLQMNSGSNGTATAGPLGIASTTTYKQVTLTNGGTFRPNANFNDNAPTASAAGSYVFSIGTGGGTFDVPTSVTLTLDDGTGSGTASSNAQLQGSGTLTKTGVGTLSLGNGTSNFAAFTGAIIVNAGTLTTGAVSTTPFGTTATGTTINSGAALNAGAAVWTAAEPLTINGTGLASSPAGALTASGAATWIGPVTLGSNATIGGGAGALTLSSTVATAGFTLTLNHAAGNQLTNGIISGSGNVIVTGSGAGIVGMSAASTYNGGTSLNSGNVAVGFSSTGTAGNPTDGPFGAGTAPVVFNGSQVRSGTGGPFTVGNVVTIAADTTFNTVGSEKTLTLTGPVTLTGASRTLTANVGTTVAGTGTIFTGAIGDGGNGFGLTKAGTGNLTLGGTNTYTGVTSATGGNLYVTGSLANNSGLSIVPAAASGALVGFINSAKNTPANFNSLALGSVTGTTTLGLELGASTATSDSINTLAAATTTGTVNLNIMALAGFGSASTYDLISASSGLSGATYVLTSAPGGYTYSLTPSASLVTLNVTPTTAGDLYWRGNNSNSWSAFSGVNANWYNDAAGSTNAQANPGAGDTVNFSTVNATNTVGVITTTLDNNFTVKKILFGSDPNGVTSVTIAPGLTPAGAPGILAIAPTSSADGLNVGSNAGSITISAPIILGANQTWSVNGTGANGSTLTVSGAISGTNTLGISGLVTLSAAATSTYSGATTVPNGGILQSGATNSFSASSAVTVSGTGILRLNGFSNTILSLAGDGTVQNNHASTAATLTAGDATNLTFSGTLQNGGVGTLALNKTGAGILTLSGTNTFTGGTTITAGTIRQGVTNALTTGTALTVNGTSVFDLNGLNASVSTLGGVSTAIVTDSAAGSGTSTLSITAAAAGSAVNITNGATRTVALRVTNGNGTFLLTNGANTFSGGIVLTNSASGTRMAPGTITAGAYGTGPITIGESPTDLAGIYFATGTQTLTNPIIFNTALGTDRVGIRTDVAGITLSGVITANLAPATFTAQTSVGTFFLTNQVTGSSGLVLDIVSASAAATAFTVTLNNATINPNNYQGDTVVNFNAASGKSATLQLLAANQIPNGTGTGNVFVNSNGTGIGLLSLAGGNETINGLNGSGNVASVSGTVTLTLGDNNANGNHSGAINNTAGTLSVTKIGSGTQTLSGASNFGGSLTVNGGLVAFATSPASAGPLGNSTVVNLSGGGISYTATGANALNRPIAIGGSAGTVDVANAGGSLTFAVTSSGGNLVKSGAGTAVISGTTTLNGGLAGVVVNAGTLRAGFGGTDVATVSVGATGYLNLIDSSPTAETLTLDNSLGALTLSNGAQLGFEFSGAATDSIAVGATGTAVTAGVVTLNFSGTPTAGTYNVLTAPSGGLSGATYALGSAPNGFNYTINASDTVVSVTISAYIPTFWRGGQNLSWNTLGSGTANWTDSTGTVDAISKPLGTDTVIFSAAGVTPGAILTTLDAAFTVDSLQFSNIPGSSNVTIAAGTSGTLTLTPLSTSGGIRVLSGGGNATISAPLTVGASQTWDVDPSGSLTISGDTTFTGSVNKTNTGVLTLSGNNSGAAAFTLSAGTLILNSATAVGTGTFTIGAGTTINTAAANTLTNNNVQNWIGDFTFTGTNNLDLGTGAVTLGSSLALTTTSSTLTVGGNIGDGGNNRSLAKAGPGNLLLAGNNTFGGGVTHNAGGLILANNSALGAGTLRINGGTVAANGTVVTTNTVEANADFSIVGSGALTLGNTTLSANRIITNTNTTATTTLGSVSGAAKTLTFSGNGNSIVGGINTTTGTLTKNGTGSLTLSGTSTYSGATTISGGTLNITAPLNSATTSAFAYGNSAATTIVNVSNNMTVGNVTGANIAGSIAVYNQTAGNVSSTSSQFASWVANSGGYGYFNLTGGTFATTGGFNNTVNTGTASTGVAYIAANLDSSAATGNMVVAYSDSSKGSLTVAPGGTLNYSGSVGSFFLTVSANSYGVLNIAGGDVNFGTRAARFGNAGANQTGFVNLAGGTFTLGQNFSTAATSENVYINYAGGTLKASANLTNPFNPGGAVTTVSTIFGAIDNSAAVGNASQNFTGGLTVNTSGNSVTLANALLGANTASNGVKQTNMTVTGGTGYIGAPMVQFTGGTLATNGAPASGYAVVSGGAVTGIVITSPGEYTVAPAVTLTGGGGTGANVALSALTANAADTGLTKIGLGTLTLSGANTFTGATLVSGGKLQLDGAAATNPTTSAVTVGTGGTLGFTAATADTLNLSTKDMTLSGGTLAFDIGDAGVNDSITVNNFALTANSAFSFTSIGAIGGTYTLVTSANPITNAGPYTITGQTIGRVTLTPTINANTITIGSTLYEGKWNVAGGGNWSLGDPGMTQGNWLNYKPTVAGDAALFGDSISAPTIVAVDTPHIVGYLRFDNANAYTIGSNGSSNLTLNNGTSNAVVTVTAGTHTIAENVALLSNLDLLPAASTQLTISGVVSGASTKAVEVAAPGTVVLSGVNTYSGTTTVSAGTLSLTGSLTGGGAVTVSGTGVLSQSVAGIISGASTLTHTSSGTSILAGPNTYSGSTTVSAGTLTLSGNRTAAATGGFNIGNLTASTGTLNVSNGTFTVGTAGSTFLVGNGTASTGIMNQSGGSLTTIGNQLLVGNGTATGTYNLSGGTLNVSVASTLGLVLGVNTGTTGNFNLSASGNLNMLATSTLQICRSDSSAATGVTATFSQTGGTATVGILQMGGSSTTPANNANANATLSLTGGTFSAATFNMLSGANTSTSVITIGGTAQVTLPVFPTNVKGTSATAAITFDSSTGYLRPAAASTTYLPASTFTTAKLTANGAKIDTNGFDITIGQVLQDNSTLGTLTKSGLGNLTLSGVNTYTGVTTINAGTLTINEGSIASSSNIVNNGALAYALTTNGRTYANAITGSGSLTKSGTNSLTLSGTNSYTGSTNVSAGTLQISGTTNTGSSTLTVGSATTAGAMTVATGGSFTTTGALNLGAGVIGNALTVQTGATLNVGSIANPWGSSYSVSGTLTSAGAWNVSTNRTTDTFNGSGIINAPSLTLGNATTGVNYNGTGAINITGAVTVACTLNTGTPFYTQSGGILNAGSMLLGDNVTNTTGSRTFNLTGGRVNLGAGGIASTGTTAATRSVNLGTGTLGASADWSSSLPMSLTTVAGVTINTLDSVNNSTARTITLSGVLSGTSNSLTKDGAGILVLSGTNTYTGPTTITAGTIQLGAASTTGALAPTSAITNNGSLVINRSNAAAQGTDFGTISGTGSLTQAGLGTTTLNAANTYSGTTTITGGTLSVSADNNLGTAPGSATPASVVINGGTLSASVGFTLNSNRGIALGTTGSTGGTIGVAAGTLSYGGVIADNGGTNFLTKTGAGTLTLSGSNSHTGGTNISGGILAITGSSGGGTGAISMTGGVRLELGAVTLTNAINLGANANVGGTGQITAATGTATISGPVTITAIAAAGGTFASSGANVLNVDGFITSPTTVVSVRLGNVNFGGGGNYTDLRTTGNVGLNANNGIATTAVVTVGASAASVIDLKGFNQSLTGMIKGAQAASLVNGTAATTSTLALTDTVNRVTEVILAGTGAGTLAFTQAGSAVQTLSGVNTYTGATTVTSGTLAAGVASVANTSGAFGNNSAVVMANDATAILDITGFNTQIGSLTGGGATGGNVALGAATLTVGGNNTSPAAYAGAVSGTGALTKIGTGTQILTGANTYTGATSVTAGTLALVGGSQASPITVSPGASLSFTLGSSTSSTSTFNVTSGTIKITGAPTLPSYTLISASTGITGTPTLDAAIPGYVLKVVGNTLVLENPYEAWAAANGATGGKAADPDGDGYINLMEFAFGTNPAVNSAGSIAYSGGAVTATGQPVIEEVGGIYYAVFGRRTDYAAAGLTYTVQFTAGLDQWTSSVTVPTVIATDGTIDAVRVPFPNSVGSPSGPKKPYYFRVMIAD